MLPCRSMHLANVLGVEPGFDSAQPSANFEQLMSVTWSQIRESLQSFDRTATLQAVQQLLDAELPALKVDRPSSELPYANLEIRSLVGKLYPILIQTAGLWYGAGDLCVGDGILSPWCWCHSFLRSLEAPDRLQQIQRGAIAILEQVEQRRNFLLKLSKLFDSLLLSTDLNQQKAQMQAATMAIVDLIVLETQCSESWYDCVSPAIAWFLESKEIPVSEALRLHVNQTVEASFTSWSSPSSQTQGMVGEAIAFELLRQEFERQYPP